MHRSKRFGVLLLVVALAASFAWSPVAAQDEMVVCDSDLILQWYVAEYYFNFAAVHDMLMMEAGDDAMGVDYATIDKGQFAPLFDSMMAMMDDMMMMPESMMSEDMLAGVVELMSGDMMMDDSMMMDDMTMLEPADMMDEPEVCAALRGELRDFFTAIAYQNAMMMEGDM